MWSMMGGNAPTGGATPSSPSPSTVALGQAAGGNSVLMEILRASVQPQPQGGHIAAGRP